jgi:hypothetical protein
MPLQPAGPALTVLFTEPVPPLPENPMVASQLLLGSLVSPREYVGVKTTVLGDTLVVTYRLVSPVDMFIELGLSETVIAGGERAIPI